MQSFDPFVIAMQGSLLGFSYLANMITSIGSFASQPHRCYKERLSLPWACDIDCGGVAHLVRKHSTLKARESARHMPL